MAAAKCRDSNTSRWLGSGRTTGRRPHDKAHSTTSTVEIARSASRHTRCRSYSSRASAVHTPAAACSTSPSNGSRHGRGDSSRDAKAASSRAIIRCTTRLSAARGLATSGSGARRTARAR